MVFIDESAIEWRGAGMMDGGGVEKKGGVFGN